MRFFISHRGPVPPLQHIISGVATHHWLGNGLAANRRREVNWNNAAFLSIGPLGIYLGAMSLEDIFAFVFDYKTSCIWMKYN